MGIDIPAQLRALHKQMLGLKDTGVIPPPPAEAGQTFGDATFGARVLSWKMPAQACAGRTYACEIYLENRGTRMWPAQHPVGKTVDLAVQIDGKTVQMLTVPHDVMPDQRVLFSFRLQYPNKAETEHWDVNFSLVEQKVAWFEDRGAAPFQIRIQAEESRRGPIEEAMEISRSSNWSLWLPTQVITRSRTVAAFPGFVQSAQGCRFKDPEGNEFIDFVMASGSAILGYAHPAIREAIAEQLGSAAITTLPNVLEMQVTRLLCETIPSAEMVLFGKHGSDACTAAVRIARLYTGRTKILCSGYHGWHDWFAEALEPRLRFSDPSVNSRFTDSI